jgi:hypothetical protein
MAKSGRRDAARRQVSERVARQRSAAIRARAGAGDAATEARLIVAEGPIGFNNQLARELVLPSLSRPAS